MALSYRILSRFLQHETSRSIPTPLGRDASLVPIYTSALGGERHVLIVLPNNTNTMPLAKARTRIALTMRSPGLTQLQIKRSAKSFPVLVILQTGFWMKRILVLTKILYLAKFTGFPNGFCKHPVVHFGLKSYV